MAYLDKDTLLLQELLIFLQTTFKGASFGKLKIDDASSALERLIAEKRQTTK